jgi:hypothetical protein
MFKIQFMFIKHFKIEKRKFVYPIFFWHHFRITDCQNSLQFADPKHCFFPNNEESVSQCTICKIS